jgi:hypothetical protein
MKPRVGLPIGSADEMGAAVHKQFSSVERARMDKTGFKFYNLSAFILDSGQAGWRIDAPRVAEELPDLLFCA